ncbi:MAG: hypothetical protein LBV38_01770 [Alistipes sp.]|jgi:hypothetical protein|nr:hypothetical protein [Alistipes sp.]
MKKTRFFFMVAVCVMVSECRAEVDYGCTWEFRVVNNTEKSVTIERNWGVEQNLSIMPSGGLTIFSSNTECSKQDGDLADLYPHEGMILPLFPSSTASFQIKVGDELLPEVVMKRKFWEYISEKYYGVYTLILSDELIETINNEQL